MAEYIRVDQRKGEVGRWGRIKSGGTQSHLRESDLELVGYRKTLQASKQSRTMMKTNGI